MAIGHPSIRPSSSRVQVQASTARPTQRVGESLNSTARAQSRAASSLCSVLCGFVVVVNRVMAMEYTSSKKGALLVLFMLSCLLLPMASSAAPLSRSLSLTNHRLPEPAAAEMPLHQVQQGAERNLGEVATRMGIEINDYPGSGANNRHEPRSPGRA